jgi:hypothetical protein
MSDVHKYNMDSVRRVARQLEMAMDGFQTNDLSEFGRAIAEYSELVTYCNQRLQDAHDRLREGNRSHAIEVAEAEPNVLDCVQELDAVDVRITEWSDTFDFYNLKRPARLLSEIADDLGQQYDVKHQLAAELRAHRLLAIGNGPIERRVGVLRRMVELDPENRHWQQDLVDYERHCQEKLAAELHSLDKGLSSGVTRADYERVKAIAKQLADVSWQEPVDAAIVGESQAVEGKARRLIVRSDLAKIAGKMRAAREADDVDRGIDLLSRWQRLTSSIALPSTDPLAAEHDDVIRWAEQESERRAAEEVLRAEIGSLSAVLSIPAPAMPGRAGRLRESVRAAQQRVYAAAEAIDESAQSGQWVQAASNRIAELDRRIRTGQLLIAAGVATMLAAVVGGAGLAWHSISRSARRSELIAEIDWLIDAGKYPEARDRIEDSPTFAADPEVDRRRSEIARVIEKAGQAKESIGQAIDEANGLADKAEASAKALGASTSFDSTAVARGETAHADRRTLNTNISDIEEKVRDAKKEKFHEVDGFDDDINRLKTRHDKVKGRYTDCVDTLRKTEEQRIRERLRREGGSSPLFRELESEIKKFESFSRKTEPGLRTIVNDAKTTSSETESIQDVRDALDRASEKGPAEMLTALEKKASTLPERLSATAREVTKSKKAVDAALAWSKAARTWRRDLFGSQGELEEWKKRIEEAQDEPLPYAADSSEQATQVEELMTYLTETIEGEVPDGIDFMDDYLSSKVFGDNVLEVDIERHAFDLWYFIWTKPDVPGYFISERDIDHSPSGTDNPNVYIKRKKDRSVRAKHLDLATKLREDIKSIKDEKVCVDEGLLRIMEKLLTPEEHDCGEADELLRARLMLETVTIAQARPLFEENTEVQRLQEDLASRVGDNIQWVVRHATRNKPADQELERAQKARPEAEDILRNGKRRIADVKKNLEKKQKDLAGRPDYCRPLRYIGWADDSEKDGPIRLSGRPKSFPLEKASGAVFAVIAAKDDDEPWKLEKCGDIASGKVKLESVEGGRMFGRPLFLEEVTSSGQKASLSAP